MRIAQFVIVAVIVGLLLIDAVLLLRSPSPALCERCNIILISLEAVGMNQTGFSDETNGLTPQMVSFFKKQGIVFEQAYAQAPWTVPAHTAILTGRYPWDLGVWDGIDRLPPNTTTLASRLAGHTYTTAMFSDGFIQSPFGFDQGFDEVQGESVPKNNSDAPFRDALNWIDTRKEQTPFFLFVHNSEIALPYENVTAEEIYAIHQKTDGPTEEDVEKVRTAYRNEVVRLDAAVGSFLENLRERNLLEETVIVLTSSNGESLTLPSELGLRPALLSQEVLHVPLVFFVPSKESARISRTVETRSITSTVLEIVGIPSEGVQKQLSLVPLITGKNDSDRIVYARTAKDRFEALDGLRRTPSLLSDVVTGKQQSTTRTTPFTGTYATVGIQGPLKAERLADGTKRVFSLTGATETLRERFLPPGDQAIVTELFLKMITL